MFLKYSLMTREFDRFDDLQHFFGVGNWQTRRNDLHYFPNIIALFIIAAAFAFNAMFIAQLDVSLTRFLGSSSYQVHGPIRINKLQDIDRFATMFLLSHAQRWVRYAYFYPFIECGAGILMMTTTIISAHSKRHR